MTDFLDYIQLIIEQDEQPEIVLMCFNPVQVICLCCEFLEQIGEVVSAF